MTWVELPAWKLIESYQLATTKLFVVAPLSRDAARPQLGRLFVSVHARPERKFARPSLCLQSRLSAHGAQSRMLPQSPLDVCFLSRALRGCSNHACAY
jgi:hypothetical protein